MGAVPSKQQLYQKQQQQSPAAAFGRLRIDSPASSTSLLARRKLRSVASSNGLMIAHTEQSSLLHVGTTTTTDPSLQPLALVVWIGPALVCALCYALYNIFIKKGSASIHPVLGGVILQFVAALLGSCLLAGLLYLNDEETQELEWDRAGVAWAVLAGAAVGAAEMLSFVVSGMGVQAMQSIPIIIGGSVMFGTMLGYFCLHELLTCRGWAGVALIAAGITLVGTDPGGAGSVH
jgi:transporter family protein